MGGLNAPLYYHMTYTTTDEVRELGYNFTTTQSPDLTNGVLTTKIKKAGKIVKADTEKVVDFTNIRKVETDVTFLACYDADSISADYSAGWATGRNIGTATVSDGYLNLNAGSIRYIDYKADDNADSQQVGCVRFVYVPNYTGVPTDAYYLFTITEKHGSIKNGIQLYHFTDGKMYVQGYNSAGVLSVNTILGAWSPVSGTAYEIEVDYDFTTGATRVFIDGTQLGATDTNTMTRSAAIGLLRVGAGYGGTTKSNAKYSSFIVFNSVQHTEDYTPAGCMYEIGVVPEFINLLTQYKSAELALVYLYSRKREGKVNDDIQYWADMYQELLRKVLDGEVSLGSYSLGVGTFSNTARNGVEPALGVGKWGGHYYKEDMQEDQATEY